jgi:hypothetical protein
MLSQFLYANAFSVKVMLFFTFFALFEDGVSVPSDQLRMVYLIFTVS